MANDVLFFDLGDTLVTVVEVDPQLKLEIIAGADAVLNELTQRGFRMGLISNTRPVDTADSMKDSLTQVGILKYFEEGLLVYSSVVGKDKSTKEIFVLAAQRAGVDVSQCVFVGETKAERDRALDAGFKMLFADFNELQTHHSALASG